MQATDVRPTEYWLSRNVLLVCINVSILFWNFLLSFYLLNLLFLSLSWNTSMSALGYDLSNNLPAHCIDHMFLTFSRFSLHFSNFFFISFFLLFIFYSMLELNWCRKQWEIQAFARFEITSFIDSLPKTKTEMLFEF